MMTERGIPSQMQAKIGKPEPVMAFGKHTNKFQSGFGADGSQINSKKGQKQTKQDFAASQKLEVQQL